MNDNQKIVYDAELPEIESIQHVFYQYEINTEDDLGEVYLELYQDFPYHTQEVQRLGSIIRLFKSKCFTIVAEGNYVDKQYRDSYYTYFSQKYEEYERNCVRLVFFEGKIFPENFADYKFDLKKILIGCVVLRPLNVGNIGQTLLNPQKLNVEGYYRTCNFNIMIYGRKLDINAFPFSSQDGETTTCAETALFNIIDYYGNKYSEYRVLMPSEILQDIERESYERVLPSQGVYEANIAKVLLDAHFYPKIYAYDKKFKSILYTYVESGIPLILLLPEHVVLCVGHGKIQKNMEREEISRLVHSLKADKTEYQLLSTADVCYEYIVMDDNKPPYFKTTLDSIVAEYAENAEDNLEDVKNNEVSIIVPVYRRIFIDAARADSIFKSYFWENNFFLEDIRKSYDDMTWGVEKENPFVWRMYLTASRSYKDFKTRTTKSEQLKYFYMDCALPRFIWVLEITTIEDYANSKARVEVLLDATSSPYNDTKGIISIGYKDHFVYVPDELYNKCENDIEDEDEYFNESVETLNAIQEFQQLFNKKMVLTKVFNILYDNKCQYFDETFEMFENSNLERNF